MAGKSFKVILCTGFVFSMMALAACEGKESKDSAVEPTSAAETQTEAVSTSAAETQAETAPEVKSPETKEAQSEGVSDSGKFATVADFANSKEVQDQLEMQKKSLEGSGMDIAITGEDNKLIYAFTYLDMENQEGMAEALKQGLESQEATFVSVAKSIKLAVDVENPVVVVQYLDANGEEIYSAEFTAE